MNEKVPPQNVEAEKAVLGAVMLDNAALDDVSEKVGEEDFYREAHRKIFSAMLALGAKREAIDLITLTEYFNKEGALDAIGGQSYLAEVASLVPTAANARHHARIVRDKALRREILRKCMSTIQVVDEEEIDILLEGMFVDASRLGSRAQHIRDVVREVVGSVEGRYSRKEELSGIPSGFYGIDTVTDGWQSGDLVIVAARPSMGKSAFVGECAINAGAEGFGVHIVNCEMRNPDMVLRHIASRSGVNLLRMQKGFMRKEDFSAMLTAAGDLGEMSITYDDASSRLQDIVRSITRAKRKGAQMAIVDYLQLVDGTAEKRETREREIGRICTTLKGLAKRLDIPIICVAQLSREVERRENKKPMLSDLRDSGQLEQDADMVIFLYREFYYSPKKEEKKNEALAIIAKGRNRGTAEVPLHWDGLKTKFSNETEGSPVHEENGETAMIF